MSEPRIPVLLYLDVDFDYTLDTEVLAGVPLTIIPELITSYQNLSWPSYLSFQVAEPITPHRNVMTVYEPTRRLLRVIYEVTHRGGIDIVVIGNNLGAGLDKAACVATPLLAHTIVISNSGHINEPAYRSLGITRFATRMDNTLPTHLLEVLGTLGFR